MNHMQNEIKSCPYARRCGGCDYQGMSYEEQLIKKQKRAVELLKEFGRVEPIIGMQDPYHYRNKVHAVFDRDRNGNYISGVYEKNSHRVVDVKECLIENQKADEIIATIRSLLKGFKIKTYNEDTGYGLLRHVLVRTGHATGQILVVLVLASPVFPSKNNFVKALLERHPEITSIVLNVNDKRTSMVLGEREIVLYGKGYIEDDLCGYTFRISPRSFYQINAIQTEKLYRKAITFASLTGKETVFDAYCGIGTIGLIASGQAKKVIGVELNKEAVKDAITNAKRNKAENIRFYCEDAGVFITNLAKQKEHVDVVFLDPPRSGSTEAFLSAVASLAPDKVVYVSCNPETLARDLKFLKKKHYRVEKIAPVDMFPWTSSIETVVLLSQRKADDYVEVEFELDELKSELF